MVTIDPQIALGRDFEIDEAVAGQLLQHMVEETNAGGDGIASRPIQIDLDADIRLASRAVDRGAAPGGLPLYGLNL